MVLSILYVGLLGLASYYWISSSSSNHIPESDAGAFSILIPFRNESKNLESLCDSLENQTYESGKWECIFIDDHSEDNGWEIITQRSNSRFRIILNTGIGKKAAIKTGLSIAKFERIAQIDADGLLQPDWLKSFHQKPGFVTGPVQISNPTTWLQYFQVFDLMALMGITYAGIRSGLWYMANGANMVYPRALQQSIDIRSNPYQSGDDMFLVERAKELNIPVSFIKDQNSIVKTAACENVRQLIHQRLRWATKNKAMKSWGLKMALSLVILFNLSLIILPILRFKFIVLWIIKMMADYIYFKIIAPFFNTEIKTLQFITCSLFYPFFISVISMLSALHLKYEWKGRKLK